MKKLIVLFSSLFISLVLPTKILADDKINSISVPNDIQVGKSAILEIGYEAEQDRDIQVIFQLNSNPWTSYGTASKTIKKGSGTVRIKIKISGNTPVRNEAYKYAVYIAPKGGGYGSKLDSKSRGNVNCIDVIFGDLVKAIETPPEVVAGDRVTVISSYEASVPRDIIVQFRSTSDSKTILGFGRTRVQKGAGQAELVVSLNESIPKAVDTYQFDAAVVPIDGNYGSALSKLSENLIDSVPSRYSDDITSLTGPSETVPGEIISVTVKYHASVDRDLLIKLRSKSNPNKIYSATRVTVVDGMDSRIVPLSVKLDLPIAQDAYELLAMLVPIGADISRALDLMNQDKITGVTSIPWVRVPPNEYAGALRNPLKGFRPGARIQSKNDKYSSIVRSYIPWADIENHENDTVQKIRDYCNTKWKDFEKHGMKVIPRVYLDYDAVIGDEHWPSDMTTFDYSSEQFKKRLERLIMRLGEVWDNDPRVAWVQMGIIGRFGEHHNPSVTNEIEKLMGDAFTKAFKNKRFLARHAADFQDYKVGYYWDSWAHHGQTNSHGAEMKAYSDAHKRWETHPIEGETAYNWGAYKIQPGDNPDDTLTDPVHFDFFMDLVRSMHCSGLGWISSYSQNNTAVAAKAAEVQKAFGYRFVVSECSTTRSVDTAGKLRFKFKVKNTGSAPFYEDWPIEFSFVDPSNGEVVWKYQISEIDIRDWMPGDDWDNVKNTYQVKALDYDVDLVIPLPSASKLPAGEYWATLAILDPSNLKPAVRLAIDPYIKGDRHPLTRIAVGVSPNGGHQINPSNYDDPMQAPRSEYSLQKYK